MKALAIGCHPDDVEIFCAGTLALLQDKGWEVAIGIVAKGDCGSMEMGRREISAVRHEEAVKAAALMGAELYFMGQNDLHVEASPAARRIATEVVRKANPDLVITHPPSDYMTDHEMASRLARDACFCSSAPNFETEDADPAPPTRGIPALVYCSPPEGIDLFGRPAPVQFFVNVESKMELKRDMLACHASQRNWLRDQHGIDQYIIEMEHWAQAQGERAGLGFAEGFHQHLGHAYPRKNLIAEALGDLVVFYS
jgi:LmbE family N-acetylglucosaminyl deacetylase